MGRFLPPSCNIFREEIYFVSDIIKTQPVLVYNSCVDFQTQL